MQTTWRVLLCYLTVCLTLGPPSSGQSRPASQPTTRAELSAIPYLGFRLLNVELSADGSRALANFDQPSAQRDVVAIYDVATGKQLLRREAKRPETLSFIGEAISPDGKHVAIAEMDAKANSSVRVLAVDGADALDDRMGGRDRIG